MERNHESKKNDDKCKAKKVKIESKDKEILSELYEKLKEGHRSLLTENKIVMN